MTSKDVAKLAGVSRSTVSRVINSYPNVPETTRKKVQEIIDRFGYIPDSAGRSLAGKKNKVIGIFIIDQYLIQNKLRIHELPYLSEFIGYSTDFAELRNYNILISIVSKRQDYNKIRNLIYSKIISGSIFIGRGGEQEELEKIIKLGEKCIIIDQLINEQHEDKNDSISIDYKTASLICKSSIENLAEKAIKMLIDSIESM